MVDIGLRIKLSASNVIGLPFTVSQQMKVLPLTEISITSNTLWTVWNYQQQIFHSRQIRWRRPSKVYMPHHLPTGRVMV